MVAVDRLGSFLSWGFQCEEHDGNTKQLFKLWLDRAFTSAHDRPWLSQEHSERSSESEQWSYYYLHSLIEHAILSIREEIRKAIDEEKNGMHLYIHYVWSTPTT